MTEFACAQDASEDPRHTTPAVQPGALHRAVRETAARTEAALRERALLTAIDERELARCNNFDPRAQPTPSRSSHTHLGSVSLRVCTDGPPVRPVAQVAVDSTREVSER